MNMKKEYQIAEEVEKTLLSFDNDFILEENPFLLTRIEEERKKLSNGRKKGLQAILGLNQALLFAIIIINLVTMVYYFEWNAKHNTREKLVREMKADFQFEHSPSIF